MIKVLSRTGDAVYALIIVFLVAGLAYAGFNALGHYLVNTTDLARDLPLAVVVAALVTFLGTAVALLEKALPLVGFTHHEWIYTYRPQGTWPSVTADMVAQMLLVAVVAGLLGYAVFAHLNWALVVATFTAVARVIVGMRSPATLAGRLHSGRRKQASLAVVHLYDSEAASSALAAMWGRSPRAHAQATASQWRLGVRRLVRRSYLGVIAVLIISGAVIAAHVIGVLAFFVFAVAWSVLAAGVYRAVSLKGFAPIVSNSRVVELAFLAATAVAAALIVTAINGAALSVMFYAGLAFMVVMAGYWRGQPRSAKFHYLYDPATGSLMPVGILGYFTCALPAVAAGLLLMAVAL